eukprot:m.338562 g.338562  ORF g.338562 m.338562 type:complete len:430 (+) comp20560_c1_seq2:87-1376(+)
MDVDIPLWASNIEERLADDKNVVTYKWLSRAANVPSNIAKQMLHSYSTKYASKHPEGIEVIYLLGGIQNTDEDTPSKKYIFRLAKGSAIEKCKTQFHTVTTEHIYSLQLVTPKDITNVLYHVDMAKSLPNWTESNKWSSIKCSLAKKISDVNVNYTDTDTPSATHAGSTAAIERDNRPKGKATSAVSFFGTLHSKAKDEASKKSEEVTRGKQTPTERKLSASKSTPKESRSLQQKQKPKRKNVIDDDEDDDDEQNSTLVSVVSKTPVDKVTKEQNTKTGTQKSATNSQKKTQLSDVHSEASGTISEEAKKPAKDSKKRKAVESAGEPEEHAKAIPQQPSITSHTTNTSAAVPGQKRTRKVIKKVKKCYQGPGGYMITDTVDVEEEIEISEEEFQRLNAPKVSTLPKKESGGIVKKKKQASMMSFFSKKK